MKNYLLKTHFKPWLSVLLLCFFSSSSLQTFAFSENGYFKDKLEEIAVSGVVTSFDDGSPIPGVNILVKGSTTGTVTDINGAYRISVDEDATLVFSAIGFTTEEVAVNGRSVIDISMVTDIQSLTEVVVTGYSTQERRDITGAVSTVSAEELTAIPAGNAEQQLQGRVAGVTVITSGTPGSESQVRVRGFGSFTNNRPLFVIDGVPTDDISFINSNDVESTTILKDAGAASIYGSRASAGVVIITTKKGKAGKPRITYDGSYGVQAPGDGFDILTPQETAEATWIASRNSGGSHLGANGNPDHPQYGNGENPVLPNYILPAGVNSVDESTYTIDDLNNTNQIVRANKTGTDWYDELTDIAPIQNHTLGISGATDNANYYVGLGYYDQEGVVMHSYFKRYSLRANTQFEITDNIRIGENFVVTRRESPGLTGGNLNEGNAISFAYRQNPIIPVYDIRGNYAGTKGAGLGNPQNPVAIQQRNKDDRFANTDIFGNIFAEIDILENLTARTSFGGRYGTFNNQNFTHQTYEQSENVGTTTYREDFAYMYDWVWSNTLQYEAEFGDHRIGVLAGMEALGLGIGRNIFGQRSNYFISDPSFRTLDAGDAGSASNGGGASIGTRLVSYFGKADYSFMDKYLLGLTLRYDGSSNFSDEERFGLFPAATVGWRISEEAFLNDVTWMDDLKIRAGWGRMGNQAIAPGNQQGAYSLSSQLSSYAIGGSNTSAAPGLYRTRIGNPAGRWETNETVNVGLDGTFFNNSLEVVIDIYKKKTFDLLFNPEVAAIHGYLENYPFLNIGEMENRGIDLQIINKGRIGGELKYDAELTFSHYKNEILKVTDGTDEFQGPATGSSRIGSFSMNRVGHSISSFYGYQVVGLWQSDAEVNAANEAARSRTGDATAIFQNAAAPGRFRYADANGDGIINSDDRVIFGDPNPDFTYGFNLKLAYKRFDLEAFFYGVQGQDIINYTRWFTDFASTFPGGALGERALYNSWSPSNPGGTTPILEMDANFSTANEANSYYMEDGSYFRARNVQIGYNFPENLLSRYGIEKFKVYLQGTNLFTITDYSGLDPAIMGVDTNFGIDYGNFPIVRQYLVGVNLVF